MRSLLFTFCLVSGVITQTRTILETMTGITGLSTLVSVLDMQGYKDLKTALNSPGTLTVFAPDNAALRDAKLDVEKIETVTAILNYHILGSVVYSTDLKYLQFPETLSKDPNFVNVGDGKGQVLFIEKYGSDVMIHFSNFTVARVVVADIKCSNGVIHIVDKVITLPPIIAESIKWSGLGTLLAAVTKAQLVNAVDTTAGITLFAPTDEAFRAAGIVVENTTVEVLVNVLKFHVVPNNILYTTGITNEQKVTTLQGGTLTLMHKEGTSQYQVEGSNFVVPNVLVENGVVHFIDRVLIPNNNITSNKHYDSI